MKLQILIPLISLSCPVMLAAQGLDTAKIDEAMGRAGQKTGDVYRLGFPRTDLHVSVAGVDMKPGLGLGSWAAFAGNDNDAAVIGTWFSWKASSHLGHEEVAGCWIRHHRRSQSCPA